MVNTEDLDVLPCNEKRKVASFSASGNENFASAYKMIAILVAYSL